MRRIRNQTTIYSSIFYALKVPSALRVFRRKLNSSCGHVGLSWAILGRPWSDLKATSALHWPAACAYKNNSIFVRTSVLKFLSSSGLLPGLLGLTEFILGPCWAFSGDLVPYQRAQGLHKPFGTPSL